jgi:hypothetical protein
MKGGEEMNDLQIFIPITKADESRHEIYGIMTAEEVDKAGECLDYEGAKPEIQKWSDEINRISKGKSKGNLRRQHNANDVVGKVIDIVFNDTAKQVECCAKVTDERTFSDILSGVISGFSIGGSYLKSWVDENGVKKYIPKMTELSVVDSPCCGNAVIEFVKADGTTETKTFTKKEDKPMEDLTKVNDEVMSGFKEALAKADTKKAFSFEEITNRLKGALKAQITTPFNAGYFFIKKTYADSVIICGDLDGDGDKDCYRVGYSMDADGVITLGKIEAVRAIWVPAIDEDNPNQEFGLPKAHKADEATDLQKADESEELSKADEVEKTAVEIEPKDEPDVEKTSIEIDEKQEEKDKEEVEKRDFSAEERKKLAEEGKAMPDGSFPIENKEDLKNAIRLVGQAKDKEKAMAFIRRRAKALDAEDMIPDTWGKAEKADEAEEMTKADCQKEDVFEAVCKAMENADDENVKKGCSKLFHKIVEKGLYCKCDKCAKAVEDDKAEKATSDTDLHKAVETEAEPMQKFAPADELAKAMGVIDELKKAFDGLKSDNDELRKQVEKLENEPVAGGAMVATGTMALDKTIGGSMGNPPANNSEEAMLRKMIDNADSPILKEAYSKQLAQLEMKKVFG